MPPPTPPSVNDGRMTSGKPSVLRQGQRLVERAREPAHRNVEPDFAHRVFEQQAVFGDLDGLDRRANQLDVVLLEDAGVGEVHRQVQRRLPADRRQDRVGPFDLDDGFEHFRRQRLDVGAIGELGVRHDRRRVAVDEDDFEALAPQRLAGLAARVVELARLTDDDRARADDEHAFQIGASWHFSGDWWLEAGGSEGPSPESRATSHESLLSSQ